MQRRALGLDVLHSMYRAFENRPLLLRRAEALAVINDHPRGKPTDSTYDARPTPFVVSRYQD